MKRVNKAQQRAIWMADYEDKLVAKCPEMRGKVDWDTAIYFFLSGKTTDEAVATFTTNHAE